MRSLMMMIDSDRSTINVTANIHRMCVLLNIDLLDDDDDDDDVV